MPGGNGSLGALVDVDRGMVSREIFVSEEIYRQELEQVFARAWLFVEHESQIPRPGDFAAYRWPWNVVTSIVRRFGFVRTSSTYGRPPASARTRT